MITTNAVITRDLQTRARYIFTEQFNQLHRHARIKNVWARFRHQDQHLQDLFQAKETAGIKSSQDGGIQLVPINRIRGSEGRVHDFDAEFRPLKKHSRERWLNVAAARYMGQSLPPVTLVRLGCDYFVRDGHHRISVAKAMGQNEIEAEVTLWHPESEDFCASASLN
jgi:hypothetical protein